MKSFITLGKTHGVAIAWWKVLEENFRSRGFIYEIYKIFYLESFTYMVYQVIVISQYEWDILVITRVRGEAEDEGNN